MIRCNLQIRVSAGKFSAATDHDFGLPLCDMHFTEDRVLHVDIHPNTTRSLLKLDLRKDVVLKNERTIENRPEDLTRHYAIEGSGSVGIRAKECEISQVRRRHAKRDIRLRRIDQTI